MQLRNISLAVIFALTSSSALANGLSPTDNNRGDKVENKDFSTLDKNGDGRISQDEYYSFAYDKEQYRNWDKNRDNRIDEKEWNEQDRDEDFASWDTNRDGYLDRHELNEGSFSKYDEDGNNYIDEEEWEEATDDGWFDDWF